MITLIFRDNESAGDFKDDNDFSPICKKPIEFSIKIETSLLNQWLEDKTSFKDKDAQLFFKAINENKMQSSIARNKNVPNWLRNLEPVKQQKANTIPPRIIIQKKAEKYDIKTSRAFKSDTLTAKIFMQKNGDLRLVYSHHYRCKLCKPALLKHEATISKEGLRQLIRFIASLTDQKKEIIIDMRHNKSFIFNKTKIAIDSHNVWMTIPKSNNQTPRLCSK